ncbi:hypothetical protein H112_08316 [Trichophyton rubrum D6]|uniref:Phosphatidate phosphatase APP1 catalytic domain-containing protein n=4 Tax=Trichophyton TaxID=5550 RepID=A0A178ESS3_TRIRU|nr:uncharacterized protein TERG_00880 [Trichophyton rubrum CBS 118892]EZF10391.1 hypothetical protein H100_08338 [Trichophyton rubrum MR850]EZF37355.1 hypothetical protein H102_08298 [Trichophyton rubrum CBS 100081]EZF47981.1 hypothetical protein H103_08321 [Trichophyton rubrum CBS 288.86]EZF58601.1 hypothetical protein H104_08271 [Trichophyton rubrum CBS 289.86]EZF69181.1 hypothetical protein H105_08325 [Trichophyton soudanense CBS 452.61]EZF79873.1 hypothetical protein H110_08321 [Trichophy
MIKTTLPESAETPVERQDRENGGFPEVENKLALDPTSVLRVASWVAYFTSSVSSKLTTGNQLVDPKKHIVWLFDNTAYQPDHGPVYGPPGWKTHVVGCVFEKHGRRDIGRWVAIIADLVGLDGNAGLNDKKAVRNRIATRVQPFLNAVVPNRFIDLEVPVSKEEVHEFKLNSSKKDGIAEDDILIIPALGIHDGSVVESHAKHWGPKPPTMKTVFAAQDGWAVISDVDDTIKYTQTPEAIGILKTTFVDDPKPIDGMPESYKHIQERLNPTWFYLSASPYNLYSFLHGFLRSLYPQGTLLLRENSWMDLAGLLKSFTQGTQEYKVNQLAKVFGWFPRRKILCIGDSTQSDPEAYAEAYKKHNNWIKAIYIRKVTDVANMEGKNDPERFEKAFEGVPRSVWKVFETADELDQLVEDLQH